jgi:hypothetical protein
MAALLTAASVEACPGVVPACALAHCRQTASSVWNCSKVFPWPGRTITLGPVGIVAQALSPTTARRGRSLQAKRMSNLQSRG